MYPNLFQDFSENGIFIGLSLTGADSAGYSQLNVSQ